MRAATRTGKEVEARGRKPRTHPKREEPHSWRLLVIGGPSMIAPTTRASGAFMKRLGTGECASRARAARFFLFLKGTR